jgi:plasmid stability protein
MDCLVPTVTIRDLPTEVHVWIKQQAAAHHRSINKEIVALLESLCSRRAPTTLSASDRLKRIQEISERCARAPELDHRKPDEIIGYAEDGTPR